MGSGRAGRTVEDVDGVVNGPWPKPNGGIASGDGGADAFHHGADGTFGDAVQLVDVWRAR